MVDLCFVCSDVIMVPGQQYPGAPVAGQQYPGAPVAGQQYPGAPVVGQQYPGQPAQGHQPYMYAQQPANPPYPGTADGGQLPPKTNEATYDH